MKKRKAKLKKPLLKDKNIVLVFDEGITDAGITGFNF